MNARTEAGTHPCGLPAVRRRSGLHAAPQQAAQHTDVRQMWRRTNARTLAALKMEGRGTRASPAAAVASHGRACRSHGRRPTVRHFRREPVTLTKTRASHAMVRRQRSPPRRHSLVRVWRWWLLRGDCDACVAGLSCLPACGTLPARRRRCRPVACVVFILRLRMPASSRRLVRACAAHLSALLIPMMLWFHVTVRGCERARTH